MWICDWRLPAKESPLKYFPTCAENILATISTKKHLLGFSSNSWEPVFVYILRGCKVHDFFPLQR